MKGREREGQTERAMWGDNGKLISVSLHTIQRYSGVFYIEIFLSLNYSGINAKQTQAPLYPIVADTRKEMTDTSSTWLAVSTQCGW